MSVWTTKLRAPALGIALATTLVVAGPLQAAESAKGGSSKQESIGVLSGLTVGALAGGPIGAVIGATTGALLGDRYHKQSQEKAGLAADLSQKEGALALTRKEGEKLGAALDRGRDLETSVGFRTGDSTLSDEDIMRLQKLGGLAGAVGKVKVRVSGYADPRGSKEFNAALSEARADAVAHVLIEAGVDASQLIVESRGESASKTVKGDLDGYAFDRRVTVKIEHEAGETAVARN